MRSRPPSANGCYFSTKIVDDSVNTNGSRCSHDPCPKHPLYNVSGSSRAVNCKEHADWGMVKFNGIRCSHDSCSKQPSFNVTGGLNGRYWKEHAEEGMINIRGTLCSRGSCSKRPILNVDGSSKSVNSKKHAEKGMVNVMGSCCLHYPDSCLALMPSVFERRCTARNMRKRA